MLSFVAMIFAVQALPSVVVATAPQSTEIERIVLSSLDGASTQLEDFLIKRPVEGRESALLAAGFRRIRPEAECKNFVYSKRLTEKLVRGASAILCTNKRPFVLLTNETPGPWLVPKPDDLGVSVAVATKAPAPLVASPQIGTIMPTCETDPCGTLDGKRVVFVGWLLTGSLEALQKIEAELRSEYWQVTPPWKIGDRHSLRIYASGKSFTDAVGLGAKLRDSVGDEVELQPLAVPASTGD